jgi:AcrR family transcriptional regulator
MAELTQRAPRAERSDALANRGRILEAAREVFAVKGMDAEVREIAERAGVGIGTLYRHFESREGLLAALVHEAEKDLLRRLKAVAKTREPRAALRATIHAGAEFCEQFGALTEVMLAGRLAGDLGALDADYHGFRDDFMAVLTDLLQRGMRDGIFRTDLDAPVAIAALESMFVSGMLLALAAQRSYPAAADAVADFFLAAIEVPNRST